MDKVIRSLLVSSNTILSCLFSPRNLDIFRSTVKTLVELSKYTNYLDMKIVIV